MAETKGRKTAAKRAAGRTTAGEPQREDHGPDSTEDSPGGAEPGGEDPGAVPVEGGDGGEADGAPAEGGETSPSGSEPGMEPDAGEPAADGGEPPVTPAPAPGVGAPTSAKTLAGSASPITPPVTRTPPAEPATPPPSNAVAVHAGLGSMGGQQHQGLFIDGPVQDEDSDGELDVEDIFDFGPDGNSVVGVTRHRIKERYLPPGQKTPIWRLLYDVGTPVGRAKADQILHSLRLARGEVDTHVPAGAVPQDVRPR